MKKKMLAEFSNHRPAATKNISEKEAGQEDDEEENAGRVLQSQTCSHQKHFRKVGQQLLLISRLLQPSYFTDLRYDF